MIFLLGSFCYEHKTFESKSKSKRLYTILTCAAWMPVTLYLFLFMNTVIKPGNIIFSEMVDTLLLWLSFHLSLLCLLYVMVNTFRYYLDNQGRLGRMLSENSYNVYIIHVIVIGGLALTMLNTAIPSLLKYFILVVSTYIASNMIVYLYRKIIKSKI